MKVLVINGDCIQRNSSANLCHIAYINGLLSADFDVSLLSADGIDYQLDSSILIPKVVNHYTFYGVTLYEKLSLKKKVNKENSIYSINIKSSQKSQDNVINKIKKIFLSIYGIHGIYSKFVKKATKFKSKEEFDYVLSLSTPPSSHLLAYKLIKKGNVKCNHWIQIWEDPWYSDAYGFNKKEKIFKEEKRILSFAEKVCYVSPLTLQNQKKLFPEFADKMYWQPLPHYYDGLNSKIDMNNEKIYGYFGDYSPVVRNLRPFYNAAIATKIKVNICGNPSGLLDSTENINIYPRLSLSDLKPIEDKTNVLIFLCNLKGGQIPGKIYQYSATNKIILFILDGTIEEQRVIKDYFGKFNRYIFCQNTEEDIIEAIKKIEDGNIDQISNTPVKEFEPERIINRVLKME